MSDDQYESPHALTPLSTEAQTSRSSLVARGLRDVFHSRRLAALEAINLITKHLIAVLDSDQLPGVICQELFEAHNWLDVDHVVLLLTQGNELRVGSHQGRLIPSTKAGDLIPTGQTLAARSFSTQRSLIENDIGPIATAVPMCSAAQAEMCVPLLFFDEMLGVVVLDSVRKYSFSLEDMEAVESLADICAAAIMNADYFGRLRRIAYADHLTDLHNRRFFEIRISEELERAQRFNGNMSLIIADVDFMHRFNSEFSPEHGDEILRCVARVLKQELRKMDVACRYDQDDFAIVVPETKAENAIHVAEKLRRAVCNYHFPGVPRAVTISCGVADYPTHGRNRDELVAAADRAMYLAKSAGRNRVSAAR